MRLAVIVSPGDPHLPDAGAGPEPISWLIAALAGLGFQVSVLDGAEDVEGRLAKVLRQVSPGDSVLVHVSGRLARRGVVRTASGAWMPLRKRGEGLRVCADAKVSILAEFV